MGPQRAELLERLGLRAARDLVFFFPRDYQGLTELSRGEKRDAARIAALVAFLDLRLARIRVRETTDEAQAFRRAGKWMCHLPSTTRRRLAPTLLVLSLYERRLSKY